MKIQFDPDLDYQKQAIESTVKLFEGQPNRKAEFMVDFADVQLELFEEQGVGNRLLIGPDKILENLQEVQLMNGLPQNKQLKSLDFEIEMETGTGKTYVFTRTIFELHKKYGFSKFVIVVPSIAIKEGIYKSLEITQEHFKNLYNENYNYFVYDSDQLDQIRSFATDDHISIMIINIDAFRRSFSAPGRENTANIIHRANDRLNGIKPIELIQETNPVVIIDEPQSTASTKKAQDAILGLNPLCTLRYSATHKKKENLIYKLDAVDAFEHELVKQIQVSSFHSEDSHNKAYMRLVSTNNKKSSITARIELDVKGKSGINRRMVTVKKGDDLYELSNGRKVYEGYLVEEIYCETGREYVNFTSKPEILYINKAVGDINEDEVKNAQIKETIREHLDKQLRLKDRGIKVLSLFFIDKVSNYRSYDEDNNPVKGKYAKMFEENFISIARQPKYQALFEEEDIIELSKIVHDGYFSQDRQGRVQETKTGNALADESAYNLIMRDKEKLMSFKTKLSFIFSHSALREGWDNPNVFQICTLNETKSEMKKRQEVGRGLRLAVDQEGVRHHGFDINTLSVMANESYEEFCDTLQKEYEEDDGIRFGIIEKHSFANIPIKEDGEIIPLGESKSLMIFEHLVKNSLVDKKGNIQNELIELVNSGKDISLPKDVSEIKEEVLAKIVKMTKGLPIKNAKDKRTIKVNEKVFNDEQFKELWERIKHKSIYQVNVKTDEIIKQSVQELNKLVIPESKLVYTSAMVTIDEKGVTNQEVERKAVFSDMQTTQLPDIITILQNETDLTRQTIVEILQSSNTFDEFKRNPQRYIEESSRIINDVKNKLIVDGIKYSKTDEADYYSQELFRDQELIGYFQDNMIESEKSVYDYVVYDSDVEQNFAVGLENNRQIKVFAKLPNWFTIPTPLGSYNPDWAILKEEDNEDVLYFVVETKGGSRNPVMREIEKLKTDCGQKHFESLDSGVHYRVETTFEEFITKKLV